MNGEAKAALEARYGGAAYPQNIRWNDTIATLLDYRSVRAFRSDPLPDGTLETLVAAAQSAPVASNMHSWSVIAITDPALKTQMRAFARVNSVGAEQVWIDEAPLLLLWVADLSRTTEIGREAGMRYESLEYFDSFVTATIDASLAAQNAIVAARSLGLGTVPIGAMRNRAEEVAAVLGLPPRAMVLFGLVVGNEDMSRPSQVRPRPVQAVPLHRNGYDAAGAKAALAGYEATMTAFQTATGQKARGWLTHVTFVNEGMAYLDGREHYKKALYRQDFDLR